MDKLVSVIIPTYKRPASVVIRAIESVMSQTYKNIEIVVVDDNGENYNQYSLEIEEDLYEFDNVRYIKHKTNRGACAARNTGIVNCNGEYVAFLDDDDSWKKDKIEKQMLKFADPSVGFVYCGLEIHYEDTKDVIYKRAIEKENPVKELLKNNYIGSTSCGMVKKADALSVGMFDEKLNSGQDQDFWIRLAQHCKIACVDECLVIYTFYKSGTITTNYSNRLASNLYLKNKYKQFINRDIFLKVCFNLKIAKAYWLNNRRGQAIKYMILCWL